jgi:hypothetical protein
LAAFFGAAAREKLFVLEKGTVYLNHGSYGAVLRPALEAQRYYQASQPAGVRVGRKVVGTATFAATAHDMSRVVAGELSCPCSC